MNITSSNSTNNNYDFYVLIFNSIVSIVVMLINIHQTSKLSSSSVRCEVCDYEVFELHSSKENI